MKLPINLDSLRKPLSVFLLIALFITVTVYGVLNDEQRAKEASNLQKEILSAMPSSVSSAMSANKEVTWSEAGKQLLALEAKREEVTQLFQERFKKTETPKSTAPPATPSTMKSLGVAHVQPIVVADPSDTLATSAPVTPTHNLQQNPKKKIKKRKPRACCVCKMKKTKRKKASNSCG